ncbi:MAG: nitroreductase family protein [Thermoanaerobaculia bacterium]|nr:nitroreductase family protein [Thermoanaerobaculia bacterium]
MSKPQLEPLTTFRRLPERVMRRRARAFLERMKRRRTVRQFSSEPVPRQVVEDALRTAATAPSGANRQPWHFVVVEDADTKRRIRRAAEKEERDFYEWRAPKEWLEALEPFGTDDCKPFLETAPYLIVIFAQLHDLDQQGEVVKNYYVNESVGIATGLLITALHQAGLVTLTHTPSPMRFLNEILGRPKRERPYLVLVVGYPADDARVPRLSKKDLDEIATFL